MVTGWLLATFEPMNTIRSLFEPVGVRAGGGRHAQRLLEPERAGRVAHARGVVDRVGAHRARRLLGGVVGLVGGAAAGEVDADALGPGRPDALGRQLQRLVPRRSRVKPRSPARRTIGRGRRPSARSSALERSRSPSDVGQQGRVERRHRVHPQQPQADVAQVHAVDRPVAHPLRAERAAVADALVEDPPRVARAGRGSPTSRATTSPKLFGRCSPIPNGFRLARSEKRRAAPALLHAAMFARLSGVEMPSPTALAARRPDRAARRDRRGEGGRARARQPPARGFLAAANADERAARAGGTCSTCSPTGSACRTTRGCTSGSCSTSRCGCPGCCPSAGSSRPWSPST